MAFAPNSTSTAPPDGYATHEVLNQPGALSDYNAFATDRPLTEAVRAFGADWAWEKLERAGAVVGSEEASNSPGWPIATLPSCAPMTGSAIGSTRSSSTRPITS